MQTRKALEKLSKGDKVYQDRTTGMLDSQKFIDMYDERERAIIAKKNADSVPLPFLESIKRKVAKMVSSPNDNLPVVTRFDLHTGIRKLSERAPADGGLKRLSSQLEKAWHVEPLGALTYGDVSGLVRLYRDQYPRSKAADAIEAECSRVGMHKLPVAKLARLAASISTQSEYDDACAANGYDGDRPEQVRARTLIRELVALRGTGVDSHEQAPKDTRDIGERLADRIARDAALEKEAGYQEALSMLEKASQGADQLIGLLDSASMELFGDGINTAGQLADHLSNALAKWQGSLTDLRDEAQPMSEEQVNKAVPAPAAPPADDGVPFADPDDVDEVEDVQLKNDMGDAGLKKKWYDPRTWSLQSRKAGVLAAELATIASSQDSDFGDKLFNFAKYLRKCEARFAQLAPLPEEEKDLADEAPGAPEMDGPPGMGAPAPDMGAPVAPLDEEGLAQGVQVMEDIQEVSQEVLQEAPPEAMSYIDHEMGEGHTAPPGTAEWGAEEILNEGHEFAPPSEGWLQEEMEELGMGADPSMGAPNMEMPPHTEQAPPMGLGALKRAQRNFGTERETNQLGHQKHLDTRKPEVDIDTPAAADMGFKGEDLKQLIQMIKADPNNPAWDELVVGMPGHQAAKGKGIPLPDGKIKQQPNDKSLVDVPEDGGKALKASEIEAAILDGKTVASKSGSIKILVNENDEVELWDRSAGRACDLANLDVAIADFINMANHEVKTAKAAKRASATIKVVDVPCDSCATVSQFQLAASVKDQYQCECGNRISAGLIHSLVKLGQLQVSQAPAPMAPDYNALAQEIVSAGDPTNMPDMIRSCMHMGEENPAIDPDVLLQHVKGLAGAQPAMPPQQMAAGKRAQQAVPAPGGSAPPAAAPAPAAPPAAAPAAPGEEAEAAVTDMPVDEVIKGAFVNYKAQGMKLQEALRTFMKEHGDLMESTKWTPEADAIFVAMQTQYYTSAVPAAAPAAPAAPAAVTAQKLFEVTVKKMKDHVSLPSKPLGKDNSQDDLIPSPGKIKQQQGKPQGTFSNTDMGKDSDGREIELAKPKKTSPTKGKLPNKDMGSDSEGNDPFPVPGLGKKPSVSKK